MEYLFLLAMLRLLSARWNMGGGCMPRGTVRCRGISSWYRVQDTCVTTEQLWASWQGGLCQPEHHANTSVCPLVPEQALASR